MLFAVPASSSIDSLMSTTTSSHEDQDYGFKMSEPAFVNRFLCPNGSTNGLMYGFCFQSTKIFICNLITKHVVAYIPNPKRLLSIALACDPNPNPNFGFSIIAIDMPFPRADNDPNCCCQFEVYSSETGEWWVSKNAADLLQLPSRRLLRGRAPVYIGGKVYWSLVTHILWFDVEQDVAGLVPCLDKDNLVYLHPVVDGLYIEIGMCNGELSYSKMTKEGDAEIWLLRNTSSRIGDHHEFEWVKRHTVRLQEIVQQNWRITAKLCHNLKKIRNRKAAEAFLCQHSFPLPYLGGEVVWFRLLTREGHYGKIFSINLRTQESKLITDDVDSVIPFSPTVLPCPT